MRLLVFDLRPLDLEEEGLVAALHARLATVEDRAGLNVVFDADGVGRLPAEVEHGMHGIAWEALKNVLKHAGACCVSVQLSLVECGVMLEIVDDGVGFDPERVRGEGGIGLESMTDRARAMEATMSVNSQPGQGTRITVAAPIDLAAPVGR